METGLLPEHLLEEYAQPERVGGILPAVFVVQHGLLALADFLFQRDVVLRLIEVSAAQAGQVVMKVLIEHMMCEHSVEVQVERVPKLAPHPLVIKLSILCVRTFVIPMSKKKQQLHQPTQSITVSEGATGKLLILRMHKTGYDPCSVVKSNPNCSDVAIRIEWEKPRCLAVKCESGCFLKLSDEGVEVTFAHHRPVDCVISQAAIYESSEAGEIVLKAGELRRIAKSVRWMKYWHPDVRDFRIINDLAMELVDLRFSTKQRLRRRHTRSNDVTGI